MYVYISVYVYVYIWKRVAMLIYISIIGLHLFDLHYLTLKIIVVPETLK